MRITQKSLIDYYQIDGYIQVQKFVGERNTAAQLFNMKQDMNMLFGRLAPNYSLLVSVFEDKSIKVEIVPHDYKL
jgi:hypothetical protein